MWIIVFLVCLTNFISSRAQDAINLDSQSATEDSAANQGVKWDSARQPVTLSIRDGRSEGAYKPEDEFSVDEQALYYSNQWQPFILPIGYNQYGEQVNNQPGSDYSAEHKFAPTFLRRPDLDANMTATSNVADNDKLTPTPMPYAPLVFYPQMFNLYPNENNEGNSANDLQNLSTSTPQVQPASDPAASGSEDARSEIVPAENFPISPAVPRGFYPMDFYRNQQRLLPPLAPSYLPPYPVLPFARDGPLQPILNRNFNRETGSIIAQPLEAPVEERPIAPDFVPLNEAVTKQNIPSEISPTALPPTPFSYPVGGYPFGVPVPPFVPPFVPSNLPPGGQPLVPRYPIARSRSVPPAVTPPAGLPVNLLPFPQLADIPRENHVVNAVLPTISANPPIEAPDALESEAAAPLDIDTQTILENEKPDAAKTPYEFGYDMNDGFGTDQHRKEVSDGSGVVTGSYGYRDVFGIYRLVNYIADKDGFRAFIKSNEPGVASSGSANVVVMAERPPPREVTEGLKVTEPGVVVSTAEGPSDLLTAASENGSEQ